MSTRIECDKAGYEGVWIDFRERGWRFSDRRKVLESVSDFDTLGIILTYIDDWYMVDVDGKDVPFKPEVEVEFETDQKDGDGNPVMETKVVQNMDLFDDLDDTVTIPWIISAWFLAKYEAMSPLKET